MRPLLAPALCTLIICCALSLVPLTACQPASSGLRPTLASVTQGPAPSEVLPSPVPAVDLLSLPRASSIPTDLPWIFAHNDFDLCPAADRVSYMIAIDRAGQLTRLSQIVTAYARRPGAPPLLLACGSDGSASLLDPQGWTSVRLDLEPGTRISQMVLSPDQGRAALLTMCEQGAGCNDGQAAQLFQIVDLRTGALSRGPTLATSSGGGPYHISGSVDLLGWGQAGLYYSVTYSKAGGSYLMLIDPYDPQAASRELANNRYYALDCAHDLLVRRSWSSEAAGLSVLDLRHGTRQLIDQGPGLSLPAIAPDGSALAYLRRGRGNDSGAAPHTELVRFDLARSTQTILAANLGAAAEMQIVGSMQASTIWSQDSQRIIAVTQSAQGQPQASLLTRDGGLISTLPLPNSRLLGVTADDQLVLEQSDRVGVSWLPIGAGAAPYAAPIGPIAGYLVAAPFLPSTPGAATLPDSQP